MKGKKYKKYSAQSQELFAVYVAGNQQWSVGAARREDLEVKLIDLRDKIEGGERRGQEIGKSRGKEAVLRWLYVERG